MHALVGTPQEGYRYPRTRFVAQFLGQANVASGTYAGTSDGYGLVRISDGLAIKVNPALWLSASSTVDIVVRAHRIQIATDEPQPQVGLNRMEATVKDASFLGNDASYFVEARPIRLQAVRTARAELIEEGRKIWLSILPEDCILLGSDGQRSNSSRPVLRPSVLNSVLSAFQKIEGM